MPRGMTPRLRRTTMGALAIKKLGKMSDKEYYSEKGAEIGKKVNEIYRARINEKVKIAEGKAKTKIKTTARQLGDKPIKLPPHPPRYSNNIEDRRILMPGFTSYTTPKSNKNRWEKFTPTKMNKALEQIRRKK